MPLKLDLSAQQDPMLLRPGFYPPTGDQNGALVKFAKALLTTLPAEVIDAMPADVVAEVQDIVDRVDAVKTTYPKPEGIPNE